MKSTLVVLASLTALVVAQNRPEFFPDCSLDCLDAAVEDATDCSNDDAWCQCIQSNYEAIYDSGVNCVMQECGPDTAIDEVLPAGVNFCSAATLEHEGAQTTAPPTQSSISNVTATTTSGGAEETSGTETSAGTDPSDAANSLASAGTFGLLVAGLVAAL